MQKRLLFGAWLLLWFILVLNTSSQVTQNPSAQWERLVAAAAKAGSNSAEKERLLKLAVQEAEKFGPEDPRLATTLYNLAEELYWVQNRWAEATPLYQRSLAIREKALGSEHPDVAANLDSLAALYLNQLRYGEAEPLSKRSLAIREKALGPEHPDVATSLNLLGMVYSNERKYADAEPLYNRALAIYEKVFGPEDPEVARSLNNIAAALYLNQGRYAEAESLFKRALAIWEKALGLEHPDVAYSLNKLAALYKQQGRYAEAEPLFKRALAIREEALGPEHPMVRATLDDLAATYVFQGKYAEVESLIQRALAIYEKTPGREHGDLDVAGSLYRLGEQYFGEGKYAEADALYKGALLIKERELGPEHPDLFQVLNSLAIVQNNQHRYADAESILRRALAIAEKAHGPEHPDVAAALGFLAAVQQNQGKYSETVPLYQRLLAIREKELGPKDLVVARILGDLSESLRRLNRLREAEEFAVRAQTIRDEFDQIVERRTGIYDMVADMVDPYRGGDTVSTSFTVGKDLYRWQGKEAEAEPLFERRVEQLANKFQHLTTFTSEGDRIFFLLEEYSYFFHQYYSFCLANKDRNPALVGKMYDVLLWQKGMVANSIAALRSQIMATGNSESLMLFAALTATRTQLANLVRAPLEDSEDWRRTVEQLNRESNYLERKLVQSSALDEQKLARATWRDVQKALGPDEAAVEFTRFQFQDGKKWTDTYNYAALVITPQMRTAPALILLGDARRLEGGPLREYREWVDLSGSAPGEAFYNAFWKPLETALAGSKRIYLSPDGILNQVSFGIVPTPDGRLLMEKYNLRTVSSTRDLLREKSSAPSSYAVLIGNPQFDLSEPEQRAAVARLQKTEDAQPLLSWSGSGLRSREERAGRWSPLPATKVEVEIVRDLLEQHQWRVETYTGENALEETVKRVKGPRVVHLATHGFFFPDQERVQGDASREVPSGTENPMLRSGLAFAGANRSLSRAAPDSDLDDGIMTAYEATGLNLHGTELVVLSACETGLGQVQNGEGVFGLRRALQEAGAEAVLMALWKVPDQETQELMTLFYRNWLAGQDKHDALQAAQVEMRRKVQDRYGKDLPFFWGGFLLVGR